MAVDDYDHMTTTALVGEVISDTKNINEKMLPTSLREIMTGFGIMTVACCNVAM